MSTQPETINTYNIDPSHSRIGFSVRHMGFTKVRGNFEQFEGTVRVDPDDLETLHAQATIQARSITTHEAERDEHLRSGDFLLVEEHPEIVFDAKEVQEVSDQNFTVIGELSIRGVTKEVELTGEVLGFAQDPWGNMRIALEAETKINRKDFGVNFNQVLETGGLLVGEQVEITLDIEAVQEEEEEQAA